jgi:hypothetical protein
MWLMGVLPAGLLERASRELEGNVVEGRHPAATTAEMLAEMLGPQGERLSVGLLMACEVTRRPAGGHYDWGPFLW